MAATRAVLMSLFSSAVAAGVTAFICYKLWNKPKAVKKTIQKSLKLKGEAHAVNNKKIHVITSADEWQALVTELQSDLQDVKVLGFDCEWVPVRDAETAAGKVALVQLASYSGFCALVRICQMDTIPESLSSLLADKSILKVGVASIEDGQKLHAGWGLSVQGCVDLRYLAIRSKLDRLRYNDQTPTVLWTGSMWLSGYGLQALTEHILGINLSKDPKVRCSNWEAETLSEEQTFYAAMDALVAVDIFMFFVSQKLSHRLLNGVQEEGFGHPANFLVATDFNKKSQALCQGIIDVRFTKKHVHHQAAERGPGYGKADKAPHPSSASPLKPCKAYSARQKPLYHNCQLQAPDGQLLCTCDESKANWYMDKGLGEKISDDPLTVRLLFEPMGRPCSDRNYYIQEKKNICVVCGCANSFIRKTVVPHEYRKHFPPLMKDHKSHDVVLMCTPCHRHSTTLDMILKSHFGERFDAPIGSMSGMKYKQDHSIQKVKSAAKALLSNNNKIPADRLELLQDEVKNFYGVQELDEAVLTEAADLDPKMPMDGYMPHGEKVVQGIMEEEGLLEFERMWRQHFLDTMQPRYLPDLWSVNHSHEKLEEMSADLQQAIAGH